MHKTRAFILFGLAGAVIGNQTGAPLAGADIGAGIGGLAGLLGAGAAVIGGQLAEDGEEAFEKKMEVQVFVCPQCREVSFKYRKGL